MRTAARFLFALLLAPAAWGQTVAINGTLGDKALLIVDGGFPKSVALGATHMGVKVVSMQGDTVVVEVAGKKMSLRVGDAPANVGTGAGQPASGTRVVLAAGRVVTLCRMARSMDVSCGSWWIPALPLCLSARPKPTVSDSSTKTVTVCK